MPSERIFVRPQTLGHGLIDKHGRGIVSIVLLIEIATSQERDMHGAEISRTDKPNGDFRLVGHGLHRMSFKLHGLNRTAIVEWNAVDHTGGFNSRQGANALKHLTVERDLLLRLWEGRSGDRRIESEHVVRIEAGIDVAQHP